MRLPVAANDYDRQNEQQTRFQVEQEDGRNLKRDEHLKLTQGAIIYVRDPATGEYLPLGMSASTAIGRVADIPALRLRTWGGTPPTVIAAVNNYFAGDGGGHFRYDATDTTSADDGGVVIVDIAGNRWKRLFNDRANVRWWGVRIDDVDSTTALTAVRTWAAAQAQAPAIYFPPGLYRYSTSPNWAITNLSLEFDPGVTLTCTGSGNAVDIDAGISAWANNITVRGWPLARCSSTAGFAWYLRGLAGGYMELRANGCGTSNPAIECQQIVSIVFNRPTVNVNQNGGWYNPSVSATPAIAMRITRRGTDPVAGDSGYPLLIYPDFAGTATGLSCDYVVGVGVLGGAMQGHATVGYVDTIRTRLTRMWHVDFESNPTRDVDCSGYSCDFMSCHMETLFTFRAGGTGRSKIIGGECAAGVVESGYLDATLTAITYDFFSAGTTITDNGTRTTRRDLLNISGTNARDNARPAESTVVPGGATYNYTNNTGGNVQIRKIQGTETFVGINGNLAGVATGQYTLRPGDTFDITGITVAPTIIISVE